MLAALADDLDAPTAVAAVQEWVDATLGTTGLADTSDPEAAATIHRAPRRGARPLALTYPSPSERCATRIERLQRSSASFDDAGRSAGLLSRCRGA